MITRGILTRGRLLATAGAVVLAASAPDALGQEGRAATEKAPEPVEPAVHGPHGIERIVVTAQRREEALIDVPISISVLDGDFVSRQGMISLADVAPFSPNTSIRLTPTDADIRIRGFGTRAANKGFEQSVGLVYDGVPYLQLPYYSGAVFDVERVEVLRGPQGTLHGKNTVAGLFHVIPREATDEATGRLGLQLGTFDRRRIEAALGGPVVEDVLNVRVAAVHSERGGFVENTTAKVVPEAHATHQQFEYDAARVRFVVPKILGSRLKVSYDYFRRVALGGGTELTEVPDSTRPMYEEWDPNADLVGGNRRNSIDFPDGTDIAAHLVSAAWSAEIGDWQLDVVAGHSVLSFELGIDLDASPFPGAFLRSVDDGFQTTAEARLTSGVLPGLLGIRRFLGWELGTSDVIGGVFFQRRQIGDSAATTSVDVPVYAEFVARQGAMFLPPGGVPPSEREESTLAFEQDAEAIAGFGQVRWKLLPRWSILAGLRIQNESKRATWERTYDTPTAIAFLCCLMWDEFVADREQSELHLSPKLALHYEPNDDTSLFARWARAFKGGGFNEFASGSSDPELEYAAETADEWALDARSTLLDGAASVGVSLFWMEVENLQVLTSPAGSVIVVVLNAARARARGVEADLAWWPSDWLTVVGTLGLNDTELLDFKIGVCSADREDEDGDGDPRCDHTGQPLERAPKWMVTVTPTVTLPFGMIPGLRDVVVPFATSELGLRGALTVEYQDTQFLDSTFDERKRQGSFFRLKGVVGFGALDGSWALELVGENLTDVATAIDAGEIPLGPGHIWKVPESPRALYGHFRWSF